MKRLIIFLIRHYLGLRLGEEFRFINQKSGYDTYYFEKDRLMKITRTSRDHIYCRAPANVSLNWLLNDECEIDVVVD